MKSLALVVGLAAALTAGSANAAAVSLFFEGNFTTTPNPATPTEFTLVLDLDASGTIISGLYQRASDPPKVITVNSGGSISGTNSLDFSFVYDFNVNVPATITGLTGASNMTDYASIAQWEAFLAGDPAVGTYTIGNEFATISLVAVPEPGTWALMGGLVAGASAFGWRRRKAAKLAA